MGGISERTIVAAAKDQVSCDLAEEAAILHIGRGVYYGLNPAGAYVWRLIQEPRSVGEIRDALLEEYDVEPDRCERDIIALLHEMEVEGLIEVKGEAAA